MGKRNFASALIDHLNTALLVLDDELHVCFMNPAAESLFEQSLHQVENLHVDALFYESEQTSTALYYALESQHAYTKREAEISLNSSQHLLVDYFVSPIQLEGRNYLLMELQSLDRLFRISREEAIISTQATTRTLVRGLAHEIKNPLGGIRGSAQLLARMLSDNADLHEYTDIIIQEADRLRNLVDKMLGPNKLPEREPTNIHEVLERVYSLIAVEADGRVNLRRDYDPSIPEFMADREQLIQVVLNIVRNAMQALLEQTSHNNEPRITLRTRAIRQFTIGHQRHRLVLRLDIIDNGPGIPEEIRESLFYPMISGRADGTGLGLSIAQSIVNQHRGIIECESVPGQTQFTIYLPLE